MVDKLKYKYLYQKRDVYYFSKQIPKDIRSHYLKDRMIICLRTKCPKDATKLRNSILSKLNSYCHLAHKKSYDEEMVLPILKMVFIT